MRNSYIVRQLNCKIALLWDSTRVEQLGQGDLGEEGEALQIQYHSSAPVKQLYSPMLQQDRSCVAAPAPMLTVPSRETVFKGS